MESIQAREIHLLLRSEREMLAGFLHAHHLRFDDDIECAFGLFDEERLLGCGCA